MTSYFDDVLTRVALRLKLARSETAAATSEAKKLAAEALDAGMTEVYVSRTIGVDRTTIRKWVGKGKPTHRTPGGDAA